MSEHSAVAVRYRIQSQSSRLQIKAVASGMLGAFGHDPTIAPQEFSGEGEFVVDGLEHASLALTIKAGSLKVVGDVSEKDRVEIERIMHQDVLETADYPEITFVSTGITAARTFGSQYKTSIAGDLSLHGAKQPLQFDAYVSVSGVTVRANGEFTIKQTDFRIRPVSVAGGAMKLKDELKVSFDVVAKTEQA